MEPLRAEAKRLRTDDSSCVEADAPGIAVHGAFEAGGAKP